MILRRVTSLEIIQYLIYSESLGKDYDSQKRSLLAIMAQDIIMLIQFLAGDRVTGKQLLRCIIPQAVNTV